MPTQHPGVVFHLRREHGGEGKAATINHGLGVIQAEGWYEAVMIIDADVILTVQALRTMTRRLADPSVGAVTAYIKEGSEPRGFLNRFVAFEYITAQAAARRAQNVLGVQACLAGGSQLVTREALEGIGGRIDTTTLAEDTVTTFTIQLIGKRVVFEPHAIVWAEEPRELEGLWKQRLRWGRGNVQVTLQFRDVWLRRHNGGRLGGLSFALIWFSVTLMPLFMIGASVGLISLYLIDREFSVSVFQTLWAVNVFTYLFITLSSFSADPQTAKRCWLEGIMFPGLISLAIIVYASYPPLLTTIGVNPASADLSVVIIAIYAWLSLSMLAAYGVRCLAKSGHAPWLVAPLVYIVGYGPMLTAMTAAAYVKELQGAEMSWDKTEKTGQLGQVL